MGPRLFSRGNKGRLNTKASNSAFASMGPRLFSRGNVPISKVLIRRAPLQWGHGFSAVEITTPPTPNTAPASFNGATAFQPWK